MILINPKRRRTNFTFTCENGKSFTTDASGFISGNVTVGVETLIDRNLEGALDHFSEALTGSTLLMDVSYKPVALDGESIVFEVSGDPASIIESLGLDEEEGASPSP